jgi:hypothetical protein
MRRPQSKVSKHVRSDGDLELPVAKMSCRTLVRVYACHIAQRGTRGEPSTQDHVRLLALEDNRGDSRQVSRTSNSGLSQVTHRIRALLRAAEPSMTIVVRGGREGRSRRVREARGHIAYGRDGMPQPRFYNLPLRVLHVLQFLRTTVV